MSISFLVILVFMAAYLVNLLYISVFYHRALAHNSVQLSNRMKRFVIKTGPWVVGLDALAWSCMHRLHHQHADTKEDPHSPHFMGIFGLLFGQLLSYNKIIVGLLKKKTEYLDGVKDIDVQVHWLYRNKLWWLPYIVQLVIAVVFALVFQNTLVGLAYFFGIMSHPIQGWLVNALAHSKGYRNFDTADKSVNNLLLGYLVFGEGYQNNHHQYPESAKFGIRWFEVDCGYWLCLAGERLGLFTLNKVSMVAMNKKTKQHDNKQQTSSKPTKWLGMQCFYSAILFCFLGILLVGCKQSELNMQMSPKVINWGNVELAVITSTNQVMGTIVSTQYGNLSFERSGKVSFIQVKEGHFIKQGTLIARLNNHDLLLRQRKQMAMVEQAKALELEAINDFNRSQRMFADKLTSQSELEEDKTNAILAKHHLAISRAELGEIENEISKTRLLAPFSGIVAKKYVEQEQSTVFGQPIIKLNNEKNFEVEFFLSQRIAATIGLGDSVRIKRQNIFISHHFELAKITEISQASDKNPMVLITAKLNGEGEKITHGDIVQVHLNETTRAAKKLIKVGGLSVPITAINISSEQKYSVYKYDDNNKALRQIAITNVSFSGDKALFDANLTTDDIIASSGVSLLRDGQSVQLRHMSQ